jgi:hypothetical protein
MLETILLTALGVISFIAIVLGLTFVAAAAIIFVAGAGTDIEDSLDD